MASTKPTKSRQHYAVAWIAALPSERASAIAMLDEEHNQPHDFRQPHTDDNAYTWGRVGEHYVVIVSLASGVYGNVMAAVTVTELRSSFPNIQFGLLVGIGGGIPRIEYDVRLGDVVVGHPMGTSSGVLQYDLGKAKADGNWERKDFLNRPPDLLLKAIGALQALHETKPSQTTELIQEAADRNPFWGEQYVYSELPSDRFFKTSYHHPASAKDCSKCVSTSEIKRADRNSKEPVIHYGVIASGNSLVKDAETRERIASLDPNCICLEMEAAGLMNSLPCLVIRGICDYADTHKNDSWQRLAAARAAAYAKELLGCTRHVMADEPETPATRSRLAPGPRRYRRIKKSHRRLKGEEETKPPLHRHPYAESKPDKPLRGVLKIEEPAPLLPLLAVCPYQERKNRNTKRVPGTCEWFINHERFKNWYKQPSSGLLWVSADPGCGKSVLARYLVDEVFPAPDRVVCYFFFKDDSEEQKSCSIAMCSVLHQLLENDMDLLTHPTIKKLQVTKDNFQDAFWDLWSTLRTVVSDQKCSEVICVLDALDECTDSDRRDLIEAIGEVDFKKSDRVHFKLLLTSRPYDHIQRGFQALETRMPVIHLSGEGPEEVAQISQEIGLVIRHMAKQISKEKQLTAEEHDLLLDHLTSVENRTYLWVHMIVDIIRKIPGFNKGDVHRAITELPSSIEETYKRILDHCPDIEKARRIFSSILVADEPLRVEDISVILAVGEDEQDILDDIEPDIEPTERMAVTIRDLCGLFVVIKDSEVHLLHQTARDFLMSKEVEAGQVRQGGGGSTNGNTSEWKNAFNPADCHRFLGSVCSRFLRLEQQQKSKFGFEVYAVWHWNFHMRKAALQKGDPLLAIGLGLCGYDMRSTWLDDERDPDDSDSEDERPTGSMTKLFKRRKVLINDQLADPRFSPPLVLAAWAGVAPVVQEALDQSTDVNLRDVKYGTTALWWAASQGHTEIVELLLKRGAKTDGNTLYPGLKPLHKASQSGNAEITKLLLDHGAKVNSRDGERNQALHFASGYGNKEVAKVLINAGAEISGKDKFGSTPLHSAASYGHLDMIQLLLEHGADVNGKNRRGYTALREAAFESDIETVDYLLDKGADIDAPSKEGSTALTSAAGDNDIPLAKHLLKRGANVNLGGKFGTALCQAVVEGHADMVELLLDNNANANWVSYEGKPVSFWLDETGSRDNRARIIAALVERGGAKLNTVGRHGRTVVLQCLLKNHSTTVQLLFRSGADANDVVGHSYPARGIGPSVFGSYRGWTALHAAAFMADTRLILDLLARGARVDILDAGHHTPLFWAMIGCVDNMVFETGTNNWYWQFPFFWTSLGIKGPPAMLRPGLARAWRNAREDAMEEQYPDGYDKAQHEAVKTLLDFGASPKSLGLEWRYSLLPGLRKFKKQRAPLFEMLETYQKEGPVPLTLADAVIREQEFRSRQHSRNYSNMRWDSHSRSRSSGSSSSIEERRPKRRYTDDSYDSVSDEEDYAWRGSQDNPGRYQHGELLGPIDEIEAEDDAAYDGKLMADIPPEEAEYHTAVDSKTNGQHINEKSSSLEKLTEKT